MQYFFKVKAGDSSVVYPMMIVDDTNNIDVLASIVTNEALQQGIIESRLETLEFTRISKLEFHMLTNFRFIEIPDDQEYCINEIVDLLDSFQKTKDGLLLMAAYRQLMSFLRSI